MSLPLFFGLLTLAPAVAAILIAALGLANRPIARVVGILTVLGALIPLVALLLLVFETPSGIAQRLNLFGPVGAGTWLSLAYRTDPFSIYAAFGVAIVIAPLLLWMVWRSTAGEAPEASRTPELAAGALAENEPETIGGQPARGNWQANLLPLEAWGGYALVLGLESAALVLCFADSVVWFAIAWVALAILAWGVGELGAAPADLDRLSLILMALGPILWLLAMLAIAGPIGGSRFSDLAGVGGESVLLTLFVMIFLALAGGVYPFSGWVRRRAIYTPPAGFGAVVLAVLPATLFAGGRTYSALQTSASTPDAANLWPQLGAATPPITIGIVLVLLGALTIAISGLLALAFRDGRTLIALLASAQVGWGMLALGIGRPLSAVALVALLATAVLGLGAMVASLFAGGMLTRGEEPEGAGPRAFGAPLQPLNLIAWMLGAVALVGAPLFGGFIARQLTTASALSAAELTLPLTGLAWVGDALLALALVRATVPAWFAPAGATPTPEEDLAARMGLEAALGAEAVGAPKNEAAALGAATAASVAQAESLAQAAEEEEEEPETTGEAPRGSGDEEFDETDETEEEATPRVRGPSLGERLRAIQPAELIGLALGVLALVIGIVPTWLFLLGGVAAAQSLLQPGTLDPELQVLTLGYGAGTTQWLPSLAWIVVAILVVLAALVAEVTKPAARVHRALAPEAAPISVPTTVAGGLELEPEELNALSEPGAVWRDLAGAIDSGWTVPGVNWLLSDLEDQAPEPLDLESDEEMPELSEAEEAEPPQDDQDEDDVPPGGTAGPGENPHPAPTRGEGPNEQK